MDDNDYPVDTVLLPDDYKYPELNQPEELLDDYSEIITDSNNVKYRVLFLDKYYRLTTKEKCVNKGLVRVRGKDA